MQGAKENRARRDLLISIQGQVQKLWEEEKVFEANAPPGKDFRGVAPRVSVEHLLRVVRWHAGQTSAHGIGFSFPLMIFLPFSTAFLRQTGMQRLTPSISATSRTPT